MSDLLARRDTAFGTPLTLIGEQTIPLRPVAGMPDLWEIPATECNLVDGWIYYYWFEITAHRPGAPSSRVRITDRSQP